MKWLQAVKLNHRGVKQFPVYDALFEYCRKSTNKETNA